MLSTVNKKCMLSLYTYFFLSISFKSAPIRRNKNKKACKAATLFLERWLRNHPDLRNLRKVKRSALERQSEGI